MEEKKPERKTVASWMLVGWQRCWSVGDLFDAIGYQPDWHKLHDEYPMIPEFTSPKSPIRAIVAQNWPKFSEYLDRGIKTKEQADRAINYLMEKKAASKGRQLSRGEYKSMAKTARNYQAAGLERAGYAARNDIGETGWNKCK